MPTVKLVQFRGEKHITPLSSRHDILRQQLRDPHFLSELMGACEMAVMTGAIYYSDLRKGDACKKTKSMPEHFAEAKKKMALLRLEMQNELKLVANDMSDSPYLLVDKLQQKFAEKLADLL